jgi:hypothetical protein
MALGSTQPLTEMSIRNLPGGKGRPAHKADNLASIYLLPEYPENVGSSTSRPYKAQNTLFVLPCQVLLKRKRCFPVASKRDAPFLTSFQRCVCTAYRAFSCHLSFVTERQRTRLLHIWEKFFFFSSGGNSEVSNKMFNILPEKP